MPVDLNFEARLGYIISKKQYIFLNNNFIATHIIHEDNKYDSPFQASMENDTCENDIQVFYITSSS